jgi:FkbM family methyltransferase
MSLIDHFHGSRATDATALRRRSGEQGIMREQELAVLTHAEVAEDQRWSGVLGGPTPVRLSIERNHMTVAGGGTVDLKHRIKRSIRSFGFEIRRIGPGRFPDVTDFLRARHVDIVLDVGANVGWFGQRLRECGYRGKIVSFEPIDAVFRDLKALAQRDGNWDAHRLALGATTGGALINVSRKQDFSSIRDQSRAVQRFEPAADLVHQEEITIVRLDDLFDQFHNATVFLKIDTQGYERPVLEGARRALTQIVGVQLELPLVHLYKCTWSLAEALVFMQDAGFVLAQLTPVNWLKDDPVSAVEVDGLFRRRDSTDE